MADASAVDAASGLMGDNLIANIQASINKLITTDIPALRYRTENSVAASGNSLSGGTVSDTQNGKFRIAAAIDFKIGGAHYQKAGSLTLGLFDLSAEAAVGASSWRGYRLFLTSNGTASFTSTADTSSSAAAFTALDYLVVDTTKAVVADFAAAPSTSFGADSLSGVSGAVLRQGFWGPYALQAFRVNWG